MKRFIALVLSLCTLLSSAIALSSCAKESAYAYVRVEVDGYDPIVMMLDREAAPRNIKAFLKLVKSGFYTGKTFYRSVPGQFVLGGDREDTSGTHVTGEFNSNGIANPISLLRGVVVMSRKSDDFNSATSQFFICTGDMTEYDGTFSAMGYVIRGMETVDKISAALDAAAPASGKTVEEADRIRIRAVTEIDEPADRYAYVEMKVRDLGTVTLELDRKAAPQTVENFLTLASSGFYDGLTFHRVIRGFMVQGGDPDHNGTGGSPTEIRGEFASNGWYNPISHQRGVISMARAPAKNSASSQFFICATDASASLDGDYAAFGRVTSGIEVVDKIVDYADEWEPVREDGKITEYVFQPVIESVRVLPAGE